MSGHLLVFQIFADFGHFGTRYTTSSPTTHLVPPRHTVTGMLAAILGIQREDVADLFHPSRCKIGITVDGPLSVFRFTLKQLMIKNRALTNILYQKNASLVPYQLLRSPKYSVYFEHEDVELMEKLQMMLKNHLCVYPLSFGMAQLLADFQWIGKFSYSDTMLDEFATKSVAPTTSFFVYPSSENRLVIDKFAHYIDSERKSYHFHNVQFDAKGSFMNGKYEKSKDIASPVKLETGEFIFLW